MTKKSVPPNEGGFNNRWTKLTKVKWLLKGLCYEPIALPRDTSSQVQKLNLMYWKYMKMKLSFIFFHSKQLIFGTHEDH